MSTKTRTSIALAAVVGLAAGAGITALATSESDSTETVTVALAADRENQQDANPSRGGGHSGMAAMVDSEFDYLVDMIPHHQEAIDNAQLLVDYSDRPEMRDFGQAIIDTQSAEIVRMEAWLDEWYPQADTTSDYEPMMGDLTSLRGDELDREFLETMIPHHMMAVMMSQQLVRGSLAEHAELVPFAENIRDVQRSEIHQMRGWLSDWFDIESAHGSMGSGGGMGPGHGMGPGNGMGRGHGMDRDPGAESSMRGPSA